ncbi:peptidase M50 [Bosea sp. F3-2]|uniref:peptidase M50 n=1 Tax=Bosea sp. F3-2 TaxID=2599640 RepID=UPI0016550499|nr:peptidase M50 [Bosea sp. F3-2]
MTTPMLSSLWYRVSALRPRLRSHVRLYRHQYRGEIWFVLQDAASGRTHRFTPAARLVMALMDGRRTVEEIWETANQQLGEDAPTQDQLIQLLGQLHARDLLQSNMAPQVTELLARGEREERRRYRQSFGNPMAIRVHLWDPDAFLNRIRGLVQSLWSPWGAALWLAIVIPALLLLPQHWPDLSHNFRDQVLSVDNLFVAFFVFPVLKILHEMGHATATKAGGGEVHDLGVLFLVFLPVPYVDATASATFKSKYQRALVGAAGMVVELFCAAVAFLLWTLVEPGLVRAVLFNVMVIAGVSTVIFNGNPLLRYDAYYILADLIEIPNLASRSLNYWSHLLERYVLGVEDTTSPAADWAEKCWLLVYGVASTLYRIGITFVIAIYIASHFFIIGVLLALWSVCAMALLPLLKGARHVIGHPRLQRRRFRAIAAIATLASVLVTGVFLWPAPSHTSAEGIVWLPEKFLLRIGANSFLDEVLVPPGSAVKPGEAVMVSRDPALTTQLRVGEARVIELEATYAMEFASDHSKAQVTMERLRQERATLMRLREREAELTIRAQSMGRFVGPQIEDMVGRYYPRGELLGYVIGEAEPLVRVIVAQDAVDKARLDTQRVRLKLAGQLDTAFEGRIIREVPAGEDLLPSRALTTEGGGQIAVDPRDQKNIKTFERMFQFDIALKDPNIVQYFGQRALVRFEHRPEPLALRWYRAGRLLFLSRFGV